MKRKGLTATIVFLAQSANFGEGIGNIATLKTLTRNDSYRYTYVSRQALRYSLTDIAGWNDTPVEAQGKGEKQVVQFAPETTIKDYAEIDLFGYMKTEKGSNGNKRSAVVRISDAISLEPFTGDMNFLNNAGMASRIGANSNLAQSEQHLSYYSYTVTVDLDKVGVDGEIEISQEEKANRMVELLECLEFLNRDIKGRNENLNPMFIIGGVFDRKNPFYKDRVRLDKNSIRTKALKEIMTSYEWLEQQTHVGVVSDLFDNDEEIKETLGATTVAEVFKKIKEEVREYYGV